MGVQEVDSFTNQKRRIFTGEENKHVRARVGCSLCSTPFNIGDGCRWVYANGNAPAFGNFWVCDACDGEDVLARYNEACSLIYSEIPYLEEGEWPVATVAKLLQANRKLAAEKDSLLASALKDDTEIIQLVDRILERHHASDRA